MVSDYGKMEKAIKYIEDKVFDQPQLEEIAEHVGLSPCHFQRKFKQWTGVSPKRYLQFLTVENAKKRLLQSSSLVNTAYDVGLSGSGRLHDLFVSVEAVTPGQFKSGGAGMQLEVGFHPTPFGHVMLAITEIGITDLWFVEKENADKAFTELEKMWPAASIRENSEALRAMAQRIFAGVPGSAEGAKIHLLLRGTNFQIKVWQALLRIPEGTVVSYSEVARRIGRPDAVRAVAGAVGCNPIAWLIPCHRVLRKSGEMGGYRWGTARKRLILSRELAGDNQMEIR